jgi:N6-adenosine-specific RNA methylase IME4
MAKALLAVIPKTVPAAKRALAALERDVDSASTYEAIRKIERAADAVKLLFQEVEEVRRHAERIIVVANHRIGRELQAAPKAKAGGDHRRPKKADAVPTLKEQVGSKTRALRLKRLAALPIEHVKHVVADLQDAGKEATVTGVLKQMDDDSKADRRAQRERDLADKILALPEEKFGVILADPNWPRTVYSTITGMSRHAANHYHVPTSDDEGHQDDGIKALDVASIAAADCVLGLWCTDPHRGVDVMRAWGFKPVAYRAWIKDIVLVGEPSASGMLRKGQKLEIVGAAGCGYWGMDRDELMLIGTRGKVPCPLPGTQGETTWFARRGEHAERREDRHSDKPNCAYEWFERHWPNTPKIELFARRERPGWARWGAEAPPPGDDRVAGEP